MTASDHAHLTTPRLRLGPVSEADPAAIVEGIGNYDVARWLGRVPHPYREADARALVSVQMPDELKERQSDDVIRNNKSLKDLMTAVDDLYYRLAAKLSKTA